MGELEGTYRILQSPGSRLGAQKNTGVSTLEPEQKSSAMTTSKQKNKGLQLKVLMLDDTEELFDVESKSYGEALLIQVLKHSNLIESDYFGLEFLSNQSNWIWLEPTKLLMKQIQSILDTELMMSFKKEQEEHIQTSILHTMYKETLLIRCRIIVFRYLFALQIKRDLTECRLTCSENTATLIVSHLLQSEIGDFDETLDQEQLKMHKYLPNQEAVQEKILQFHKKHFGQTPAESDFQVLEIARKLDMYGIRFHPAFDREGTKINLAVANMGVLVFQGTTKINTFSWAKIRKLSFKRKRFLIKLYPEPQGTYQDTLEFLMSSRDQCKILWKSCVEYHTFFRTYDQPKPKAKPVLFSRGSSFRYSGRTQKQLSEYIRSTDVRKSSYQRYEL
ncbi:FERM, ARHGEF and pleckstrin domain-containing protein 2-like [Protopterus annectens]|uniref:FERM, ARHGEF and pleckstrin domain-containing protein 2-like n=1 Tax=Protopterus annectens TaxID=7888 RepID=UPI001CFB9C25|nr:FERM, ARHGEF and pleckstrin domain-containing protein 2-like [Protopterus annectens]